MAPRSVLWASVAALACGNAAAQSSSYLVLPDPRVGTHACVVESAFVVDPITGESGRWTNHQKSFIVHVSTCEQLMAPGFRLRLGGFAESALKGATDRLKEKCKSPRPHTLVMTTTLRDDETDWDTANVTVILKEGDNTSRYEGGIFRKNSEDTSGTVAPTLALRADLSFDLVQGDKASGASGMKWWTMNGHCTPFEPDQ